MRFLGIVGLAALFLAPTLSMPYLGDDTFNNYLDGWMGYDRLTPSGAFSQLFTSQNVMGGRFYPIFSALLFSEFHYIHSLVLMKVLVVAAMLLNAATLYVLLRLVAPSLALPALALLPATWQIRFFHDPIVQFSLHMQLTLEFVLLAFIGLALLSREGRLRYLVLGAVAYAFACLTYEPVYAFAPVLVALAAVLVKPPPRKAFAIAAFAIPPLACTAIALWFRALHPLASNDEHTIHAALGPVLSTFAIQAIGAVPLAYRIFNPNNAFAGAGPRVDAWQAVIALLAFVALAMAFAANLRRANSGGALENRRLALAAATAAFCWLASGTLVALSPRWQAALIPGLAYTPVYFADACMAVLLAALAVVAVRALPHPIGKYLIAAVGALVITITYQANARALSRYAPWSMIEPQALDAGLLRDAPDGSTVYLDDSYPANSMFVGGPWDVKNYLYYHTGKRFNAAALSRPSPGQPENAFLVLGSTEGFDQGTVIAGRETAMARSPYGDERLIASIDRYTREPGHDGVMSTWTSHCGPVVASALLEGMASALIVHYVGQFYAEEREGSERWRWAGSNGELLVVNPTSSARSARLRFTLRPIDAGMDVRIKGGGVTTSRDGDGDTEVTGNLRVAPHASAPIAITSDRPGNVRPPDARRLLFQIRDLMLTEPACEKHSGTQP